MSYSGFSKLISAAALAIAFVVLPAIAGSSVASAQDRFYRGRDKSGSNEFPLKKIGDLRFGVVTQSPSQYFEFVLAPGPDGKVLYRRLGLRAWTRVQMSK